METPQEAKERVWREKILQRRAEIREEMKTWRPNKNEAASGDPYKTLFVCRLDKVTTAKRLKRVFEEYGPIKSLRMIHDTKSGECRNYAFIEYEYIDDFKSTSLSSLPRRCLQAGRREKSRWPPCPRRL